jgi:hypothetical protein
LSNVAGNRGRSLVPSTIITLVIVAMLIISGPAQAVAVNIAGLQDSYTKGSDIEFQVKIDINDPDQYVSITNISLGLAGPINKTVYFALDGTRISGDCNIKVKPVSIPKDDYGYGNGYGYDTEAGYGYGYDFGYGYGYGYGYGSGGGKINFIYNVTMHTGSSCLPAGNYSMVASLNTGKNVAFQSTTFSFRLLQGAAHEKIKAKVDIKPETINLASKGIFTAFITLPENYDVRDIDVRTIVIEGAHAVNSTILKENGSTLIAKFNTQDLINVQTGNAVKLTVTGEVDGTKFEGSDTVKVIDNGKNQKEVKECECDEHVKENDHKDKSDHENESDDQVKEQDHEDKKVKDQTPENNKEDKKNNNNGGQGKNVVINNINIHDNSGNVNVNIYNKGGDAVVNQGGNNNNNANGNKKGNQGNNNKKGNNGKGEK